MGSVRVQPACPLTCDLLPAHTQRLVHIQSMLKRAPSYRTLELELLEWQERELFEYFVVVSLKKKPSRNTYLPEVSYQFPKVRSSPPPQEGRREASSWGLGGYAENLLLCLE